MVSKFLTEALVVLAVGLGVSWVCVWLHEHDVYPIRSLKRLLGKLSVVGLCALALWVLPFIQYGSTKGGNGGTNNVQMVIGPGTGALPLLGDPPVVDEWEGFPPITSTNTTRTLDGDDFRRGFVMTHVGTDEPYDFSPSAGASVCADWRAFGAAEDWVYANVEWKMENGKCGTGDGDGGTNDETSLRIHSDGWLEMLGSPVPLKFWPLKAKLEIVPEANWPLIFNSSYSIFHSLVTPSNTLQATWQNVLLNGDTNAPVGVQAEFWTDGRFDFRYDLSRGGGRGATALPDGAITNILVGASFGDDGWTTNSLPTNVTSLAFWPISPEDAYDPDADGDGLPTIDELFVYHTAPHNSDSDYDGLTDYEELFIYHTDPLDPHSAGGPYYDGLAVKIGDLDPFAYPEGSTNTVLEHVFYSGTTNGAFAYPQSGGGTAILKVMVSGSGAGRLVVGDSVVPLVAPPQMRGGAATNTLLLAVDKGVRQAVWFEKPDGLDVAKKSDDFLIGEMPTPLRPRGWFAFPHTEATVPCIHDFNTKSKTVSLVHGEEFPGLTATWDGGAPDVVISNVPPVSASIGGNFPKDDVKSISYTLDHPKRLNDSEITIAQEVRFCPQVSPTDETNTVGEAALDNAGATWTDEGDDAPPMPALDDDDAGAEEAFTNIVGGAVQTLSDVLYLHRDNTRTESLEVPGETCRCCPCPEHWNTNYVAKVSYTGNVAVKDSGGNDFDISYDPCTVTLSGVSPSHAFHDSAVGFVTNGAPYKLNCYTVLGLKIDRPDGDMPIARYNQLSPSFGFPVEVCTNLSDASSLVLHTDVLLEGGYVRLALEGVSGNFEIWLPEWHDDQYTWHKAEKLLDGRTKRERCFSMRTWRSIMRRYSGTRELDVKVLSSSAGSCTLRFEYAASDGTGSVHDFAAQRLSSVNPVLLVDYDRDGAVGAADKARHMAGRYAYFWVNDDKWRGDDAFETHLFRNSGNDVVDGRNDLINFLPIAVNVAPFASHWSSGAVYYRLEAHSPAMGNAKFAFADIDWSQIGNAQLGTDSDVDGNALYEAPVSELGEGTNLPPAFVSLAQAGRSTLFMEFPDRTNSYECDGLRLKAYSSADDALLFSAAIKIHVGDVAEMMGWLNLRDAAGGPDGVPTRLATPDWPAEEHEPGNLVFVHGYNMAEDAETPPWAKNVFKKLWWAGLDRGFIAVQWRGNEGQTYIPGVGFTTPNYYGNVQNAFATASALKTAMDDIGGPKWFLAHSLGNMLVSAAIQDCGMPHEKFFMLNAAVAMEAFDPTGGITQVSHDNMTPEAWTNYTDRVRATHWFERFPAGDGRRLLTWKGRFGNVTNIVNFYSTQEEVVNNGDGDSHSIYQRDYVWYNQETRKGSWPLMLHEYEGEWEFNGYYDTTTNYWLGGLLHTETCHMPPAAADQLSDGQLQQIPFFLDFVNAEMHSSSNGAIVANNYLYRAEMLAYAIPAESFAVGANPLSGLNAYTNTVTNESVPSRNFNMASFIAGQEDLPENEDDEPENRYRDWQHSTFVQRSYKRTGRLYKEIIWFMKGTK